MTQQIPCRDCGTLNNYSAASCSRCHQPLHVSEQPSQAGSSKNPSVTQHHGIPFHRLSGGSAAMWNATSTPPIAIPSIWGKVALLSWKLKVAWIFWIVSGVVLIILTLYSANHRVISVAETPPPQQPQPTPSEVEVATTSTGADTQGNEVTFDIYLLSKNFSWKYLSSTDLETLTSPNGNDVFSPAMQVKLRTALSVICAGTASSDGRRRTEEERASARARTIAKWVKDVRGSDENVDPLNVGQYTPKETGVSISDQRRVIVITVIGIHGQLNNYDKEQTLKDALKKKTGEHPIFRSMLEDYSQFYIR